MYLPPVRSQKRFLFSFLQILEGFEGVAIIIACYFTLFLKPLRDRWGLSKKDADLTLPGDEIIRSPKSRFTHAIEINAPADYVWPWMAQIGQGRGGFYSYEALENLAGLNIQNADVILDRYQKPEVGDLISFGPKDAYPLVICDQGRAMAIENHYDLDAKRAYDPALSYPENYLHLTWLWYVEALDDNHSRFISRNRVTWSDSLKTKLVFGPLVEPIVFTMDRKMCLGIKKRAEQLYRDAQTNGRKRRPTKVKAFVPLGRS